VDLFKDVPRVLIFVPITLLVLDVAYKTHVFKHLPYDTVADASLATLTFSAVHLITTSVAHPFSVDWPPWLLAGVQFAIWPFSLVWAGHLERTKAGGFLLFMSYMVGGAWFAFSGGLILAWVH